MQLRSAKHGTLLCRLEEADASEIIEARGGLPERFVAKGRDGTTDILGILRTARNESGERSGVSPLVPRFSTGKLTHAARQFCQIMTARSLRYFARRIIDLPSLYIRPIVRQF